MYRAILLVIDWVDVDNETQLQELMDHYEETTGTSFYYGAPDLLEAYNNDQVSLTSHHDHQIEYGVLPDRKDKHRMHYVNRITNEHQDTDADALYLYSFRFFRKMTTASTHLPRLLDGFDLVHCVKENVVIRDASTAVISGGHHRGRPPIGFSMEDGRLVKNSNFERVRRVLKRVQNDDMSKRKAADRLDVTRKTITNLLDRSGRYGLDG